jgi:hypothetical protein
MCECLKKNKKTLIMIYSTIQTLNQINFNFVLDNIRTKRLQGKVFKSNHI